MAKVRLRISLRMRAVVAVAVLGLGVTACGAATDAHPADRPLAKLSATLGADGTTISVGDAAAKSTVSLHEDMRCPVCRDFEVDGGAPHLAELARNRKVKIEYTLASFLDDRVGGSGSKRAVNALRAALEQNKFVEYHDVLYAHQPEEAIDGFTDAYLLELADQVKGLHTPEFEKAVTTMRYKEFVSRSQRAYEHADVPGTPAMAIDTMQLTGLSYNALFDKEEFKYPMTAVLDAK
ncbi:DsbA family protein [Streptomyces celluloflavus]